MKQIVKLFYLFSFVLFLTIIINPQSASADVNRSEIIRLTNVERAGLGLSSLRESSTLNRAAELKAIDMAAKGYFSHNSPDGRTPWSFIDESGYQYSSAGENLAVDFSDNTAIMRAWMNSPGHRANIVNATYSEIGVAYRSGVYQGRPTTFVVQMFGTPIENRRSSFSTNYVSENSPIVSIPAPIAISQKVEQVIPGKKDQVAPILIETPKVEVVQPEYKEVLVEIEKEVSKVVDVSKITEEIAGVQLEKDEVIPQVVTTSENLFNDTSNDGTPNSEKEEIPTRKNIFEIWSQKINEVVGRISVWWNHIMV